MDKKFEYLPHTADAKFRAYGRTLEEAVANAALAMVSLMWDVDKVVPRTREKVEIRARNFESLIVKFLTEILYLFEVRGFLLAGIEEIQVEVPGEQEKSEAVIEKKMAVSFPSEGDFVLRATLAGDCYSDKYEIISEVKAATYNDFSLEKGPDGYSLQMVVDM